MNQYLLLGVLHEDGSTRVKTFEATRIEESGEFLVKQYLCLNAQEADALLKEAMTLIRQLPTTVAVLDEVILSDLPEQKEFCVNFILKKHASQLPQELVLKNDRSDRYERGLSGYDLSPTVCYKDDTRMAMFTGTSKSQQTQVVVRSYDLRTSVTFANPILSEAIAQAQVAHENNCQLLDIAIEDSDSGFTLSVVTELLSKDLNMDFEQRRGENRPYVELELWMFLQEVTAGLHHAQTKVTFTQEFVYSDVKPATIFVSVDGLYKLGGFGWVKRRAGGNVIEQRGTKLYLSPETIASRLPGGRPVDCFAAGIYSLGVVLLQLAALRIPEQHDNRDATERVVKMQIGLLQHSDCLKKLLTRMLCIESKERPTAAEIHEIAQDWLQGYAQPVSESIHEKMTQEQLKAEESRVKSDIQALGRGVEKDLAKVISAYERLYKIYRAQNRSHEAVSTAQMCLSIQSTHLGEEHPSLVLTYSNLSAICQELGDFQEAKNYAETCVSLQVRHFGEDCPQLATTYNSLSAINMQLGNFEEAKTYSERSLALQIRHFGEDCPQLAIACSNLSLIYQDLGDFQEARRCAERGLRLQIRHYGENHPSLAITYNNLSTINRNLCDFQGAKKCAETCLALQLRHFGESHLSLATTYNNLSLIYQYLESHQEARKCAERCLKLKIMHLGEDHPSLISAYSNLSTTYRNIGDLQGAKKYTEASLHLQTRHFGSEHPSLASSYHNLSLIFSGTGDLHSALQFARKAYILSRAELGESHPSTVSIFSDFSSISAALLMSEEVPESSARHRAAVSSQQGVKLQSTAVHLASAAGDLQSPVQEVPDILIAPKKNPT